MGVAVSCRCRLFAAYLLIFATTLLAEGQASAPATQPELAATAPTTLPARKLVVATREVPPFAMKTDDGWEGISIELWSDMASVLGLDYELVEVSLDDMLAGLADGRYDAGVSALTMTSEREARIDFTHPYYAGGLGIAVGTNRARQVLGLFKALGSWQFLSAIGALSFVLFLVGFLVWLVERKKNREQFGGGVARGLGNSFWWSAVTMTTVGYGDKAPVTLVGRLIALVWMFASIIVISGMTAAIASALTVSQLNVGIQDVEDLSGVKVGVVKGSTGADFIRRRGISATPFESARAAVAELGEGNVDAVVYDAPVLQYLAHTATDAKIRILPRLLEPSQYAIGLPEHSSMRETYNRLILDKLEGDAWRQLLKRYLGE